MKVLLTNSFDVEISIEAFRLYKKRSGLDLYAYTMIDDDPGGNDDYVLITDEMAFDYEPIYTICNKYIGDIVSEEEVWDNTAEGVFDDRTDPILISVVEELGSKALSWCALGIAEIPDGIEWHIENDWDVPIEWVEEGPPRVVEERRTWSADWIMWE